MEQAWCSTSTCDGLDIHKCLFTQHTTVEGRPIMAKNKPDCRMARQLSDDVDIASRVRLMSSRLCVPSIDRSEHTMSPYTHTHSAVSADHSKLTRFTTVL